jgi:ComF family protein
MSLFSTLLDIIYPRFCTVCGAETGAGQGYVCWDCVSGFEVITRPFCAVCGDPVEGMIEHEYLCSFCEKAKPGFDMARSAVKYRGVVCSVLQLLKYSKQTFLVADILPFLSACVTAHYSKIYFDGVTFVPLYSKKERERTFNQSRLLAGELARTLDLPFLPNCLERTRYTMTQTDLNASQRRKNVYGAFAHLNRKWLEGRTLLLVDDVMTTGATVNECSRVLKEAGAAGVFVVTVARG